MGDFFVNAGALARLPAQLDRLQGSASLGMLYVSDQTQLSYGGVLNGITGAHADAVAKVRNYLDELAHHVAGPTANAVRAAVTYYQQTDEVSAAALDETYHAADYRGGGYVDVGNGFRDLANPSDHYRRRPDYSAEFPYEPPLSALISPAAMGRHVIITATTLAAQLGIGHPWDPYEMILKPITGDWNGMRGCKDVFDNVADALGDLTMNLGAAVESSGSVWLGEAADHLCEHLKEIGDALTEAQEPVRKLAESYETAAEGAHALFGALADVLNDLIDDVIEFIAEASAAAATSETVVGGIVFGGMAAFDAYEIFDKITELIDLMSRRWSRCTTPSRPTSGSSALPTCRSCPERCPSFRAGSTPVRLSPRPPAARWSPPPRPGRTDPVWSRHVNAPEAGDIADLVAELRSGPLGERLADRRFRRQHAYEALVHNPDPIMREIGQQLRDGAIRPADILRIPEYTEAFRRGADRAAQRLDPERIADDLQTMIAQARDQDADDRRPARDEPRGGSGGKPAR